MELSKINVLINTPELKVLRFVSIRGIVYKRSYKNMPMSKAKRLFISEYIDTKMIKLIDCGTFKYKAI